MEQRRGGCVRVVCLLGLRVLSLWRNNLVSACVVSLVCASIPNMRLWLLLHLVALLVMFAPPSPAPVLSDPSAPFEAQPTQSQKNEAVLQPQTPPSAPKQQQKRAVDAGVAQGVCSFKEAAVTPRSSPSIHHHPLSARCLRVPRVLVSHPPGAAYICCVCSTCHSSRCASNTSVPSAGHWSASAASRHRL